MVVKHHFFVITILFLIIFNIYAQKNYDCNDKKNCADCIENSNCVWCQEKESLLMKCRNTNEINTKCNSEKIIKHFEIIDELDSHIKPSNIKLKLRPNKTMKLNFNYKHVSKYSVDMYFLLDISHTMKPHREDLAHLASQIEETITTLTNDVKMGFGSFVDKAVLPYTDVNKVINSCPQCAEPYVFKNQLSLTSNISKFSEEVNKVRISANVDVPEGTLEALLQSIVCEKVIGWRKNARRLVIVVTDDIFHIAGDGKLAGIVKPNDGECHVNDENFYTHSVLQDYPSIGLINKKSQENNVIIVFAVTESVKKQYEILSSNIKSSFIGTLSNSSNIFVLIEKIYKNISDTVQLNLNFSKHFDVSLNSNCNNFVKNKKSNNYKCLRVAAGSEINFSLDITLKYCPEFNNNFVRTASLSPSGLNSKMRIEIEMICDCDCKSVIEDRTFDYLKMCVKNGETEPCSNAGVCNKCGKCVCNEKFNNRDKIYGDFCECNDLPCYDDNDIICSNHGKCQCGVCKCEADFTGDKCECPTSVENCKNKINGKICSGENYGTCECGKCICKKINEEQFSGKYCDKCPSCLNCDNLKECVKLKLTKNITENCKEFENKFEKVENIHEILDATDHCSLTDNDCYAEFKYKSETPKILDKIFIESEECTLNSDLLAASIPIQLIWITALLIVLVSLISFGVYKSITEYKYKQEYARFLNQKLAEKTDEINPLYINPNTNIQNPIYRKNV